MKTPLFCFLFGKNKGAWNVLEQDSKSKLDRFCLIVDGRCLMEIAQLWNDP